MCEKIVGPYGALSAGLSGESVLYANGSVYKLLAAELEVPDP